MMLTEGVIRRNEVSWSVVILSNDVILSLWELLLKIPWLLLVCLINRLMIGLVARVYNLLMDFFYTIFEVIAINSASYLRFMFASSNDKFYWYHFNSIFIINTMSIIDKVIIRKHRFRNNYFYYFYIN
jgi:hypothetical protein